jgi:hypothetical protein
MIPSDIDLVLRLIKGSALTKQETDTNFQNLKAAILAIATVLTGAHFVFGDEPAVGDRQGILWVPTDMRGLMFWDSAASKWRRVGNRKLYAEATNTGDAFSVTFADENYIPDLAALTGIIAQVKVPAENTGATTLAVNGLAATPVLAFGIALTAGMIKANSILALVYDGTNFQLLNPDHSTAIANQYPTSVYASDTIVTAGTTTLSLALPAGKTTWKEIEIGVDADLGTAAGGSIKVDLTYHSGTPGTPTTGPGSDPGDGFSTTGHVIPVANNTQRMGRWIHQGIVEAGHNADNPLEVRAVTTVTSGDATISALLYVRATCV